MGRRSKLSENQWGELLRRLVAGEKASALAREYDVSPTAISRRAAPACEKIKSVANQLVAADSALKALPISQQAIAISLSDELKAISMHMAGAAKFGAATAHRLSGIAHAQVDKIDDADPLQSTEALKGILALTEVANKAAVIPTALLNANKDVIKEINAPEDDGRTSIPIVFVEAPARPEHEGAGA